MRLRVAIALALSLVASCATRGGDAERPNVVFILIDDLGQRDLSCYGSRLYETPNIDRLAAAGMRFTAAYAAAPVCSPTRASIMTGRYPARLHLTDFLKGRRTRAGSPILPAPYADFLPLEETTLAETLRARGYRTAHVGKWHLGGDGYGPSEQGFDVNVAGGVWGMPHSFFWPGWRGRPAVEGRFDGDYLPDRLADAACGFIERNARRPFFLYLAHYAVHVPIEAKPEKTARYAAKVGQLDADVPQRNPRYAAMIESVDESVGRVLATLARLGLDERTIVVFFSDNGGLSVEEGPHTPATSNAPWRAGKGYLYEGGIREPLLVRWPGRVPAGTVCDVPVSSVDFVPTLCALTGAQTRGTLDGVSLAPLLRDPAARLERPLFWHYPHYSNQGGSPGGAVRVGDAKLIERYEDGALELYDLAADPGETTNLAAAQPQRAAALRERLAQWRLAVGANMPLPAK